MAKKRIGGKVVYIRKNGTYLGQTTPTVNVTQGGAPATQQNQQVQIDDTQQAQPMSASYDSFMAMTDDQKADTIDSMVTQSAPDFLSDSAMQRFTYNLGLNDKPTLVDDSVLDTMNGTELFRTVNDAKDPVKRLKYDADEIAAQIQKGRVTRYSGDHSSVYGKGLYFADSYHGSKVYGNTNGNIKRTAMVRCKLNSNAKTIDHSQATRGLSREMASGSKLGKSLSKIYRRDSDSAVSIYALSKGYNVITSGHGYFNVLNRNAVTMSKTIKATNSNNRW